MSETRIDFLYLNEPDMIAAGVTDMARCVDVMEETLVLLRRGDFRMAGANAMSQCPGIEEIVVNGIDQPDVDRYRTFIEQNFPHIRSVRAASDVEEVVRAADVVTVTVTTGGEGSSAFPFIDEEWIKPGAVLLLPSAVRFDDTFIASDRVTKVVDSWRLYDAWAEEYGVGAYQKLGIIGTHWHDLMGAGLLERGSIVDMADIIEDAAPGRQDNEQIFLYSVGCMPVEDVASATEVYRNAVEKGIGTKLNLWDAPNLA